MPDMLRNIFRSAMMLYVANVRDGSISLPFLSLGFTHCLIFRDGGLHPLVLVHWSGFELSSPQGPLVVALLLRSTLLELTLLQSLTSLPRLPASSVGRHHLYLWAEQFMHSLPRDVVESLWWVFVSVVYVGRFQVFKETSTVYCNKKRHLKLYLTQTFHNCC